MLAAIKARRRTPVVLFVDVVAAFYNLDRPIVAIAGPDHDMSRTAFGQSGMPPHLQASAANALRATWLT
eukprot:15443446-Alexandrium_andersonii.AAC.1